MENIVSNSKTLAFISTHIINKAIISEYKKMAKVPGLEVILVIDNTNLKYDIKERVTVKNFYNTDVKCFFFDFDVHKDLGLPSISYYDKTDDFGQIMWYNADYRYYYVKKYFPDYDYYWQFDYDVFCNSNSYSSFFDKYENDCSDLLICNYRKVIKDGPWFWTTKLDWIYGNEIQLYRSLFPVCRLSAGAIDFLKEKRVEHKKIFFNSKLKKRKKRWLNCELFVPTELSNNGFCCAPIYEEFVRFSPEYDLSLDRIFEEPDGKLYHPVKGDFLKRLEDLSRIKLNIFGKKISLKRKL